jgi:signal transduction histidine kinase
VTLRVRLLFPILIAGLLAAALAGGLVLLHVIRASQHEAAEMADAVGRRLDVQLFRMEAGMFPASLFPDWSETTTGLDLSGFCVTFSPADGRPSQRSCGGSERPASGPAWARRAVEAFAGAEPARRLVRSRGRGMGTVEATPEPEWLAALAIDRARLVAFACSGMTLVLTLISALCLRPALKPLDKLVSAVRRIGAGERDLRPPKAGVREIDAVAAALGALAADLGRAEKSRAELAARLVIIEDSERQALARDLHDVFGQSLTGIRAVAGAIRAEATGRIAEDAELIETFAAEMDKALRDALKKLRDSEIEEAGLISALHRLAGAAGAMTRGRLTCEVLADDAVEPLPKVVAASLYRVAQEALTNAAKHSGAVKVSMRLERSHGPDAVSLVVTDDGVAAPEVMRTLQTGFGLRGMSERAEALGGSLSIRPGVAGGLSVAVLLPFQAHAAVAAAC